MKKLLVTLLLGLSLVSCEDEYINCNCGDVLSTEFISSNNYLLTVESDCGEIKQEIFTYGLDIGNGENGIIIPQPGGRYCFRVK